jgi:tetratricopeptide (TPR) repeat protein
MINIRKSTLLAMLGIAVAVGGGLYYQHQSEQEQLTTRAEHILARGIALYEDDRHDEALQMLESMPIEAPLDWRIPYYKGMALIQLKDYERAAGLLEESIVLDSTQIAPLFALGVTYFKLGQLGLSKSYFAAVLEIDPGNEEARGLINTMANLERVQVEQPEQAVEPDDG